MKLKVLDKFFWEYFKECPRKACLSYYDNNIFGHRPVKFKFKTIEQERIGILEETAYKFFEELEKNKEVSFNRMKEMHYYIVTNRRNFILKGNTYNEEYKRQFAELVKEMRTFKPLKELLGLLEVKDAVNIHTGIEATINLTEYANSNMLENNYSRLKSNFTYKLKFPFYRRTPIGVMPIHFNHSGYPFDFQQLNYELILTKLFFEKCVEDNLAKIIVYDFKTMKRYVVDDLEADFSSIRKMLETVDKNLVYPNNQYDRCKICPHIEFCRNNMYRDNAEKMRKRYLGDEAKKKK